MKKTIMIMMMLTGLCNAAEFNPHAVAPQQHVMQVLALNAALGNNPEELVNMPVFEKTRAPRKKLQKNHHYPIAKKKNRINQPRPGF